MVNRKISMGILVDMAAMQCTRQFILLTPQNLMFVALVHIFDAIHITRLVLDQPLIKGSFIRRLMLK
jgi:hypothetical protein